VDEPGDPDTWSDNYFCSDDEIGMQWSSAGPIDGMDCVNVTENADGEAAAWEDNFLCMPHDADYRFTWSFTGPIDGQTCVRWFEHVENKIYWIDNWMCVESLVAPNATGRGPSGGSSSGGERAVPDDVSGSCSIRSRDQATDSGWSIVGMLVMLAVRRRRRA
jgi:hypothetical protein